jgi:shikimate dehydrogenase
MLDLHDVLGIGPRTRLYALLGAAVSESPSPAMHRAGYREAGLDARYLPVAADDAADGLDAAGPGGTLGIEALAVTLPFKRAAFERCADLDGAARACGAVNTVTGGPAAWRGANTDGPAVLACVRGRIDPRGVAVAVAGAGGFGRAAAAALRGAGASVVLFNRTFERARRAAREIEVEARPWDELRDFAWTVLVQGTPLGRCGEDVLEGAPLCGRVVVDAVYGPETPLLRRARQAGLAAADGLELLVAQALPQFERMTGRRASEATLRDAGRAWLERALTGRDPGHNLGPKR